MDTADNYKDPDPGAKYGHNTSIHELPIYRWWNHLVLANLRLRFGGNSSDKKQIWLFLGLLAFDCSGLSAEWILKVFSLQYMHLVTTAMKQFSWLCQCQDVQSLGANRIKESYLVSKLFWYLWLLHRQLHASVKVSQTWKAGALNFESEILL